MARHGEDRGQDGRECRYIVCCFSEGYAQSVYSTAPWCSYRMFPRGTMDKSFTIQIVDLSIVGIFSANT